MSTTEQFLNQESIDSFVAELKEWPNTAHGDEDQYLGVTPYTTFYFHYPREQYLEYSLAMVDIHEEWEALLGKPYTIATHPDSERPHPYGSKRLPDLREFARSKKAEVDEHFVFNFTDEKSHNSSPATAGYFWRTSDLGRENGEQAFSYIQLYYRWSWWQENQNAWRDFVLRTTERLKAVQVYSGFSMALPLEFGSDYEVGTWERVLANHFYGLDMDHPFWMKRSLNHGKHLPLSGGLRPATWGIFVEERWEAKLGMSLDALQARLPQGIQAHRLSHGLWLELGPQPSLFPVEDGVPTLAVALDRFLKPIRHENLSINSMGEWDGDPNERFNDDDTKRWMRRFEDDSDWPAPEIRFMQPSPAAAPSNLRGEAGEIVPKSGWWVSAALQGKADGQGQGGRRYFKEGDKFPEDLRTTSWGMVIWSYDPDQS